MTKEHLSHFQKIALFFRENPWEEEYLGIEKKTCFLLLQIAFSTPKEYLDPNSRDFLDKVIEKIAILEEKAILVPLPEITSPLPPNLEELIALWGKARAARIKPKKIKRVLAQEMKKAVLKRWEEARYQALTVNLEEKINSLNSLLGEEKISEKQEEIKQEIARLNRLKDLVLTPLSAVDNYPQIEKETGEETSRVLGDLLSETEALPETGKIIQKIFFSSLSFPKKTSTVETSPSQTEKRLARELGKVFLDYLKSNRFTWPKTKEILADLYAQHERLPPSFLANTQAFILARYSFLAGPNRSPFVSLGWEAQEIRGFWAYIFNLLRSHILGIGLTKKDWEEEKQSLITEQEAAGRPLTSEQIKSLEEVSKLVTEFGQKHPLLDQISYLYGKLPLIRRFRKESFSLLSSFLLKNPEELKNLIPPKKLFQALRKAMGVKKGSLVVNEWGVVESTIKYLLKRKVGRTFQRAGKWALKQGVKLAVKLGLKGLATFLTGLISAAAPPAWIVTALSLLSYLKDLAKAIFSRKNLQRIGAILAGALFYLYALFGVGALIAGFTTGILSVLLLAPLFPIFTPFIFLGGFLTGATISAIIKSVLGGFSPLLGSLASGITTFFASFTSLSLPTLWVAIPVIGGTVGVAGLSFWILLNTSSAFVQPPVLSEYEKVEEEGVRASFVDFSKTASPSRLAKGGKGEVTYSLKLTNKIDQEITNIRLSDKKYNHSWEIPRLGPGESWEKEFKGAVSTTEDQIIFNEVLLWGRVEGEEITTVAVAKVIVGEPKETFFACPETSKRITSYFGDCRKKGDDPCGRKHMGVDFGSKMGDPIYTAASGTVSWGEDPDGYGYYIDIKHNGYVTRYAHLKDRLVKNGGDVERGDLIARAGDSGNAEGSPHLHFEIRIHNVPKNPLDFLEGCGQ